MGLCQLNNGRVAGFSSHQKAEEAPYITDLYLTPSYDLEDPPKPLLGWFWALLMGLTSQHHTFQEKIACLDDWSILAEIKCHSAITDELREAHHQIGILEAQIDNLAEKRQQCEGCLEAGKVPTQVKYLEHLAPATPQIAKRQGSLNPLFQAGWGRPT